MKVSKYIIAITLLLVMGLSVNGSTLTPDEILRRIDGHRLISNNFEMTIRMENYVNNHIKETTVMKGYVNSGKMSLLTFIEPIKMKDRKIIIKDNDMWLIIPKVKNPIRITPSQRLVGGISYGDVAAISYSEGYSVKLNSEELADGMNSDGTRSDENSCFVLELSAKDGRANYNRIVIWADKQDCLPIKADFFALSGRKMTTVYYAGPKELNGKTIITKMFLFDQINTNKHFSMEYMDIRYN